MRLDAAKEAGRDGEGKRGGVLIKAAANPEKLKEIEWRDETADVRLSPSLLADKWLCLFSRRFATYLWGRIPAFYALRLSPETR